MGCPIRNRDFADSASNIERATAIKSSRQAAGGTIAVGTPNEENEEREDCDGAEKFFSGWVAGKAKTSHQNVPGAQATSYQ